MIDPLSTDPAVHERLKELCVEHQPKLIVETGTHMGASAKTLREGAPEARIISVDKHIRRSLPDVAEYVESDSLEWALAWDGTEIDLAFVDCAFDGHVRCKVVTALLPVSKILVADDVRLFGMLNRLPDPDELIDTIPGAAVWYRSAEYH